MTSKEAALRAGSAVRESMAADEIGPTSKCRRGAPVRRAVDAYELAGRLANQIFPSRVDTELRAALQLCREATYWALQALLGDVHETPLGALDAAPRSLLLAAAGDDASLVQVRDAFLASLSSVAEQGTLALGDEFRLLRRFSGALIAQATAAEGGGVKQWAGRHQRGLALATAALVACAAVGWRFYRASDLARHRPWQASSANPACNMEHRVCGQEYMHVFFVTKEEKNPWLAIDLGEKKSFSNVVVRNRQDCCQERAAPLSIEVSSDGENYKNVAKRNESFFVWRPTFEPVSARYVRVRAHKKTTLHLERVSVH